MAIRFTALTVWAARRRITRIQRSHCSNFNDRTGSMSISGVPLETLAVGSMIENSTFCVDTTDSRARILTFVVEASLWAVAIRVLYTLRSTSAVRISKVLGKTCARAYTVTFPTNSIGTTWRRIAWVTWSFCCHYWKNIEMLILVNHVLLNRRYEGRTNKGVTFFGTVKIHAREKKKKIGPLLALPST